MEMFQRQWLGVTLDRETPPIFWGGVTAWCVCLRACKHSTFTEYLSLPVCLPMPLLSWLFSSQFFHPSPYFLPFFTLFPSWLFHTSPCLLFHLHSFNNSPVVVCRLCYFSVTHIPHSISPSSSISPVLLFSFPFSYSPISITLSSLPPSLLWLPVLPPASCLPFLHTS